MFTDMLHPVKIATFASVAASRYLCGLMMKYVAPGRCARWQMRRNCKQNPMCSGTVQVLALQ